MSTSDATAARPTVTCAAAKARIEKAIDAERHHSGRDLTFVRNAQGHVVSYQGNRPIPPEEMRLLVRQALELLDGSANAMADSMARAAPSMPKMTLHDGAVWREWSKQAPRSAQALHTWVGQIGANGPDYKAAQRNASGWQKVSDDVLHLLEKYQGRVPGNVVTAQKNTTLWDDLTADAASVGLTADIVAAAAAAAAGDLSAAERYSKELPDRISAASALANCPASAPAAAGQPPESPAPRAAPVSPPSAPHHGVSGTRKAVAAAVAVGSGSLLLYELKHIQPPCCPPPPGGGWNIVSYSPIVCSSAARQCSGSITINIPEAVSSGHPWAIAVDAGGNSYLGDARVSPTAAPGSVAFTLTKSYSGLNSCHPPIVRVGVGNGTTDNGMWATDVSYSLSCQ